MQPDENSFWAGVQTFVISLNSVPRNALLLNQLMNQGIAPLVVKAVDARSWTPPFSSSKIDIKSFNKITGRMPSGGEIGCALSHLLCAQKAETSGTEYALVFEEDAEVVGELAPSLNFLRRMDPNMPTVVVLYANPGSVLKKGSITRDKEDTAYEFGKFFMPPSGTVAYLMNKAAIDVFASKTIIEGLADWPPFANRFEFWGCFPNPISTNLEKSTIEDSRAIVQIRSLDKSRYSTLLHDYLRLLNVSKMREHGRSLGGLRFYLRFVLLPHTLYLVRYFNTRQCGSGSDSYRVR